MQIIPRKITKNKYSNNNKIKNKIQRQKNNKQGKFNKIKINKKLILIKIKKKMMKIKMQKIF